MNTLRLEKAKEYILRKEYTEARKVLLTMPNDPTAQRWLTKLSGLIAEKDPFSLPPISPLPFNISERFHQQIENVLQDGEVLLWAGQPHERRFASRYSTMVWLGIMLLIPAVSTILGWVGSGSYRSPIILMSVAGVGLLATVLYLYSKQVDIVYAVTSTRIMLIQRGRPTSYGKRNITQFRIIPWQGDTGDIIFAESEKRIYRGRNRHRVVVNDVGMYGVSHFQDVRTLIYRVFQFHEYDFADQTNLHPDLRPR